MLIKEVILENFMSYEYARVPLKTGVNVVCGPNGAGKSTILLGISVALGQSSTERSKRLSDLIRYGKDEARVTIVLDNSPRDGRRPVSIIKKDQIFLTRSLRRDGKYWFELENTAATKADVNRLLSKFEVDPENMLIIMHQNMVNQFSVLSAQQKLQMVEAAVGFESYRKNVADAQKKLSRLLSQEDSVDKLLQSAQQTLTYWREQYDRYQQKKQLVLKRRLLERELAWAEVQKREKVVEKLKQETLENQNKVQKLEEETQNINTLLEQQTDQLKHARATWESLFEERLMMERELAKLEATAYTADETLRIAESWTKTSQNEMQNVLAKIQALEMFIQEKTNPVDLRPQLAELKSSYAGLQTAWTERFNQRNASLQQSVENSMEQFAQFNTLILGI
jgi:chromosome segregation ATPase